MNKRMKILLIEDNRGDAELFREMVNDCQGKCELTVTDRLSTGLSLLREDSFAAVFLDLGLPDSSGIETLGTLQEQIRDVPVIVLTGLEDGGLASRAISLGAQDYLTKGRIDPETLYRSILYSIERKRNEVAMRERKELSEALNRLDNVIHSTLDLTAILQQAMAKAAQALKVDAAVIGVYRNDRYVITAVYNLPEDQVGRSVEAFEMKGLMHAGRTRDVVACNDAASDSRLNPELVHAFGIHSLLIAPFISKGIITGAISFFGLSHRTEFGDAHIDFARKLSFSLTTALENARLYDALRETELLSRTRLTQLEAVYASAPVGLCFVDTSLRFVNINQRLAEINGVRAEKHLGRTIRDVLPRALADRVEPYYRKVIETGRPIEHIEVSGIGPGGEGEQHWLNSYYPVRDESGRLMGVNAVIQDITGRKRMEEEIRHLANHDALTGLPNRRLFLELIKLELTQARRHGTRMAVFFLDLDRFKIINDTLGHEAGDELLKEVAWGLKRTVRASDTVARIGGDEFNIIVADVSAPDDVVDVARKVIEYFQRSFMIAGQEFHITASVGISVFPDDSSDIDTLLKYADIAMYHAKGLGRNSYQFYNPEINIRSLERMHLEHWLSRSVERGELRIHYQPQVDISTRRIVCAEALVRWQHPQMGTIDPARFIPVAEETGFISTIDEWVLREVCSQVRSWLDQGLPVACVTVNLSARLFENSDLVALVSRILDESGLPADYLDLEITESMAMNNVERTAVRLRQLANMGVHISIDDFGTGYSSLNYLKRLPIERLKIDRSFVQDITTDPDDRTIISAVTAMAHNMKMKVIAEGVETEEQLSFLKTAGCDEMQGFLFSKPLPAEEYCELVTGGKKCA